MYFSKEILKSIISDKTRICTFCLNVITKNEIYINDEIIIENVGSQCTIIVCDILKLILGDEIIKKLSMTDQLCQKCLQSAVHSYNFINDTKNNIAKLDQILDNMNNCLDNKLQYNVNSIFILLDSNMKTQVLYNKEGPLNTKSALKKFELAKKKRNDDIKTESPSRKTNNYKVRKRKPYNSVQIKTIDMLYDKNDISKLKCKLCLKNYPSLSNLRNHYIRVHAPKSFTCLTCNRSFGSNSILEAHQNESHVTLVCSECGKTFRNRHTLKMHEISHYLQIVCKDCGRVYKSQTTYKKHIDLNICGQTSRASPSDAKYTCDYCNKKYTQKVSLRVHIQHEHGNYKSHQCKWCNKKFWAPSRLKAHIVKHTQEKKFQCTVCSNKYVTKESLLYHSRSHSGEKPYKCDFCNLMFVSASRKADHTKRCHVDAIFQCGVCKIKYTTKICLENHMRTHTRSETEVITKETNFKLPAQDDIYLGVSDEEHYFVN